MKKILITTLTVVVVLVAGGSANAVTIADLQAQINALLAQLSILQGGTGGTTGTGACAGITFSRNLAQGASGSDVKCLQSILNQNATSQIASSGAGSPGNETTYFGGLTKAAVVKFQQMYSIAPTAGYVGPLTRAKLNTMVGGTTGGTTPPPVTPSASGLTAMLAYDTPAASTVADAANANFTKFTLTAGTAGEVKISKIYVTRTGLSANADLENIKIIDAATGGYVGSVASLSTDSRALVSFVPNLVIPAGTTKTFYIRAGIVDATTAGKTAVLGVNAATDIVSNASSVTGTFPINGNAVSVVALTIGSLTVSEDGTVADSAPDVGTTDVIVDQFKMATGSTEAVTIETVTALKFGSADTSDVVNIELYDVTNAKSLGTVSGWNTDEKAVWSNLNLFIDKGKTVRFKIMVDIADGAGSSKTVNADIIDGTDVLVVAKGTTYGFYVTPAIGSSFSGKGNSNQTIGNGSLNISKSALTPATGNIAAGSDVLLGVFDFQVKGEELKATQIKVEWVAARWTNNDVTRVTIYDKNGNIVTGPKDPDTSSTTKAVTFTDTFIIPVGTNSYYVKATLADSVDNGDTIVVDIDDPSSTTTVKGMISNASVSPGTASDVSANTLTIAGAALTATTLGSPIGRSIPEGVSAYVFATFSLDASAAGESEQVTSITVTDSLGSGAAVTDIDDASLWADLTAGNSVRGDVYETQVSTVYQFAAATQAFTISPTLTIAKGTYKKLALVASINTTADANDSHTFYINSSGVTSNGGSTGSSTTVTYVSTNKQTWTVAANGSLTVSRDSSSPLAAMVIGGTEKVTLGVFRLAANNVEDLDVDQFIVHATNGSYATTYYLYQGTTLIGQQAGAERMVFPLADNTVLIPANGYKLFTVKADLQSVDGTTITNGADIDVGLKDSTNTLVTGKLSGQQATNNTAYTGYTMDIYKSRPYVVKNSASPVGGNTLSVSSAFEVARFDITAHANDDITFENADGDSITLYMNGYVADTTQAYLTFTFKDLSTGNTLGTATGTAGSTTSINTNGVMSFQTNSLTVPAGETRTISITLDTTDFEDAGDSISVKLDDVDTDNFIFGINGSGAYKEGDDILKNDIIFSTFGSVRN